MVRIIFICTFGYSLKLIIHLTNIKMAAKKSANRMNVKINQNFVIRVLENPAINKPSKRRLTTANKLLSYIDEETQAMLFNKVMTQGKFKYSFTLTVMKTVRLSIAISSHENDAQIEKNTGETATAEKRLRFVSKLKEMYGEENLDVEVSVKTLDYIWNTLDQPTIFVLKFWFRYGDNEKDFEEARITAVDLQTAVQDCLKICTGIFSVEYNGQEVLKK